MKYKIYLIKREKLIKNSFLKHNHEFDYLNHALEYIRTAIKDDTIEGNVFLRHQILIQCYDEGREMPEVVAIIDKGTELILHQIKY